MKENEILNNILYNRRTSEISFGAEIDSVDSKQNKITFQLGDLDMKIFLRFLHELDVDNPLFKIKLRLED